MRAHDTGTKIATRRIAAGLTQQQLAEDIVCDPAQISRWENGHGEPSLGSLRRIAAALGVDTKELV